MAEDSFTRRDFLRVAAGGAAVAAIGAACGSGSDEPKPSGGAPKDGAEGSRTLRIVQSTHFVPAYDIWFDDYARRWGEQHDAKVTVDHVPIGDLFARADTEAAARRGHDMLAFFGAGAAVFEDEVIDHREIVEEVEAKVGRLTPAVERDIRNQRTGKYFAFADFWSVSLTHYRIDLWDAVQPGVTPDTWNDLIRAGAELKAGGTPLGLGLSSGLDSGGNAFALLFSHGASLQDEQGTVVLDRAATVDAVETATTMFRAGMTEEVFFWDDAADNRFLASGKGSLTFDPVSALRAIEQQDRQLAEKIGLRQPPAAPAGRLFPQFAQCYVIWNFSPNQELAKQFLVDLALDYREPFVRSGFYNLAAFPGAVADLPGILAADAAARPAGKYTVLADATAWSTNVGHPGDTNPAVAEVFNESIVTKMFAAAAQGKMSAEDAVKAAEAQIRPIFEKWRERGKV
jgi:multiple sugar transport system substrate-binding protein